MVEVTCFYRKLYLCFFDVDKKSCSLKYNEEIHIKYTLRNQQ